MGKKRTGARIDGGTGLGITAVKDGIRKAVRHGYIVTDIDESDLGRIKKSYALKMREAEETEEEE